MSLLDAAAGALGMSTGGLSSSLLSSAGSLVSGLFNNDSASKRQEDAQSFSAQQYATRYQTTVEDMKKAGLNPMLAYGQGAGSAPTSSAASSQGMPDLGHSVSQARVASAQSGLIEAQTENQAAQGELYRAQAAKEWASAGQSNAMVGQISATVDKIREEIKNIPSEGQRIRMASQMLSQQATLMAQQGASEQERQAVLKATAAKLRTENLISQADYDAILKTGGVGRIAREVKPISDIGSDWVSPSKWFKK